jgi:mannose-6-phosphate isomerase-like protein (cupin superfamily)
MSEVPPTVVRKTEWADDPERWQGYWEGGEAGAGVSLIFNQQSGPGQGPRLHRHPYPETFIIHSGRARFTIGSAVVEAGPGDILVAPAHAPHKFASLGPEPMISTNIHASGRFVTEWLEPRPER